VAAAALALPLDYPVYCGAGLLGALGTLVPQHAPAHRFAIIADDTVAPLYASAALAQFPDNSACVFTVPAGEHEKTRARWEQLTDALFAWGAGRDTTVIALGGGVIGDLAGFVAATFMRGIPVVQVPTTLLAMVDASVGGKTAIDTPFGKNLVGAFHNPSAVVIDPEVLHTLSPAMLRSGLAEMIKHGVIADAAYFESVHEMLADVRRVGSRAPGLESLIAGSVRIKAGVVAKDARESGLRHILNFGHTIGHAIERELNYRIAHGDAVAIGMVAEARLAESMGIAESGLARTIQRTLETAELPTRMPDGLLPARLVEASHGDKKARSGSVRYALPRRIGDMEPGTGSWSIPSSDQAVLEILATVS
jgi:3-dehydroquinate synthase